MAGISCMTKLETLENDRTALDSHSSNAPDMTSREQASASCAQTDKESTQMEDAPNSNSSTPPLHSQAKSEATATGLAPLTTTGSGGSNSSGTGSRRSLPSDLQLSTARGDKAEKTMVLAACDIPTGHSWGPFHVITQCVRRNSPGPQTDTTTKQITIQTSGGGECCIRLQEEDAWITLVCEATENTAAVEVPNIDIFFEASCELLTLVALSNITRGSLLHGRVRILPPGAARSQSPDLLLTMGQPQVNPGAPKRDKKCVYCGISFSSLDTLTAHMSSYCSRRPQLIGQQQPSTDSMTVPGNNTGGQLMKSGSDSSETYDQVVPTNAHPAFVWTDSISRQGPGKRTFTSSSGCGVANASQPTPLGFCFPQSPRPCESPPGKLGLPPSITVSSEFSSVPLSSASATPVKSVLPSPLNAHFSGSVTPAGLFADVDVTASGLATLAALASLGGRLQASSTYAPSLTPSAFGHQLHSIQHSPINAPAQTSWPPRERSERTSPRLDTCKTVFCKGCQRFYSASIYQSHVGISRQLNELTAPGQSRQESGNGTIIPIAELAESAKSLGLVLTAPLITDAGFIYVPVHAACGRQHLEVYLEPVINGGINTAANTTQRPFQSAETSSNASYQKLTGPHRTAPRQSQEQHTISTPLDLRIAQQEQQLKQSGRSEEEGRMVAPASAEEGIRRTGDSSAAAVTSPPSSTHEHQRSAPENQAGEGKNGSEMPPTQLNVLLSLLSTLLSGQRASKQDSTAFTPVSMPPPPSSSTSAPGLTPDMLSFLMSSLMSYIMPGALGNAAPWFHHARLLASQQHSQQQPPPQSAAGGYSMEALEAALLQATNQLPISPVSLFQGGLIPCVQAVETTLSGPSHVTSEERSSQEVPPTQPQRPYLCTNCHTRFQAYSTFKAHQQYYCQGRRKVAESCSSAGTSGAALQTSPPTGLVGNLKTCDGSHSPGGSATKRRRLCPSMCPKPDDRPASGDEIALSGGLKATSASPMSVAESESPPHSIRLSSASNGSGNLVNGDWELCGTSELRCRLCGYVGQTPRGMKMHNRLHECSVSATTHPIAKQHQPDKAPSPGTKSASTLESNTAITSPICSSQSFRAQPLC